MKKHDNHIHAVYVIIGGGKTITKEARRFRNIDKAAKRSGKAAKKSVGICLRGFAKGANAIAVKLGVAIDRANVKAHKEHLHKVAPVATTVTTTKAVRRDESATIKASFDKLLADYGLKGCRKLPIVAATKKHGHKVELHVYGKPVCEGSAEIRRYLKFKSAEELMERFEQRNVFQLVDDGWTLSRAVAHQLKQAAKSKPEVRMDLDLFGYKADRKTGEKDGCPVKDIYVETAFSKEATVESMLLRSGLTGKQIAAAIEGGVTLETLADGCRAIGREDAEALSEFSDKLLAVKGIGPKAVEKVQYELEKLYICPELYEAKNRAERLRRDLTIEMANYRGECAEEYLATNPTFGANYEKEWHTVQRGHYNKNGRAGKKDQLSLYKRTTDPKTAETVFVEDLIPLKYAPFHRELARISGTEEINLLKVNANIPVNDEDPTAMLDNKADWESKVRNGIRVRKDVACVAKREPNEFRPNTVINGSSAASRTSETVHLEVYGHGTNGAKRNEAIFAESKYFQHMWDWMNCGANEGAKKAPAKGTAYNGLLMVATKKIGVPLQPEDFAFLDGTERKETAQAKYADTYGISGVEERPVQEKLGDGAILFHVSKKKLKKWIENLPAKQARQVVANVTQMDDSTIRGPKIKGCMYTSFDWHTFLHDNGIDKMPGTDIDIDDVVCLADTSVLKATVKEGDPTADYNSVQQWCDGFHKYGHRFGRLLASTANTDHDLPYQVLLHTVGVEKDGVEEAAKEINVAKLLSYKDPAIAADKFTNKFVAEIAKHFPGIANQEWVRGRIDDGYARERRIGMEGIAKDVVKYHFAMPDPVYLVQTWFGLKQTGCIRKGEILTKSLSGEGYVFRNPFLTAQGLRKVNFVNKVSFAKYAKYFTRIPSSFVVNAHEYIAEGMQCDFDGDKLGGIVNQLLVKLFNEYFEKYGHHDVTGFAPKAKKEPWTKEAMRKHMAENTGKDELGRAVDMAGSLLVNGDPGDNGDAEDWLAWLACVIVDLSKSGNEFNMNDLPNFVANKVIIDTEDGPRVRPYPHAMGLHKARKNPDREIDKINCLADYGENTLDVFGKAVRDNAPEKLELDLEASESFDYRILMSDMNRPHVNIKGVCGKRKEDALWSEICSMNTVEWNRINSDAECDCTMKAEWRKWKAVNTVDMLVYRINERNRKPDGSAYTVDDAYDCVLSWMFKYADHAHVGDFAEVLWSNFWQVFGEMAVRNMNANIAAQAGLEGVELDVLDDEFDFDAEYEELNAE